MPISRLSELTWEEVRDRLSGPRTVAVLPTAAIEAHGPHLPLATDVIIAEAMARSGAEKLAARGYDVLVLPTLSYTAAEFAASFPGTISLGPAHVSATIVAVARSLAKHGLRLMAVANSHLDPEHIASIEAAAATLHDEGTLELVFPDITRKPWALRLSDEFKSGACHAGRYESSVVMAARPELVREAIRKDLRPNPSSLSDAIRKGVKTFEEAEGPAAYFGYPAEASAEEGFRTIETLGSILEEAVLDASRS